MTNAIGCLGALLLLAPALAAAQDQVPPPKQETVTIRAVDGTFQLKGTSSADLFGFTQQCESKSGYSESTVSLTLPLDIEGGPNDSLERATTLLRDAVARGLKVVVEPSSEAGKVAVYYWGGLPEFQGVIASVAMKYTLFLPDGTPVRATASVTFKEAGRASFKKGGDSKEDDKSATKKQPDCSPSQD